MTTLYNPLVSGFNPDPSVVRVGDAWFLATSTFEYLPGLPIYKSTDFENWQLIGHVATREGQFAVEQVPTAGGAWAPTIRHRDGVFHIVITDALGRGMLHFTATDPAGPWSDGDLINLPDGVTNVDGIDPDLAWDDEGTAYVTYSALSLTAKNGVHHRGIEQVRVDLATHTALEEPRSLWSGSGSMFPEAPHLYSIDGFWYLLIAEGGTERGHGISIARGDSPLGPFTASANNPLVSARSTDRPVQNTGHGDLVLGPDGQWLVILLGVRPRSMTRAFSALGRETFVTEVTFTDGWPAIAPVQLNVRPGSGFTDGFDTPELGGDWVAVRRLPTTVADLGSRPGHLVLTGDATTLDDPRPVFVGFRQKHLSCEVTAVADVTQGLGGLGIRYDERFHVELEADGATVTARVVAAGLRQEWSIPGAEQVELHLSVHRPTDDGILPRTSDVIELAATVGGVRTVLAEVDGRFLSSEMTESFAGRVIGLFAVHGTVAFDSVTYEGKDD